MKYSEFKIQVQDTAHMNVTRPNGIGGSREMPVAKDRLKRMTIESLSRFLGAGTMRSRDDLQVLGSLLFQALFAPELAESFWGDFEKVRKADDQVLRVILEFEPNASALAGLPWEYLYFPDGEEHGAGFFIAADVDSRLILARHVPLGAEGLAPTEIPLRILFVVSQPSKAADGEWELGEVMSGGVISAVQDLAEKSKGRIEVLEPLRQPTREELTNRMRQEPHPHIVHFMGHGRYDPKKGGMLALVGDDHETAVWIKDQDLPSCFPEPRPRLIFLHACEGAHTESYEAFRGLGLRLVYERIPAVVAMQYEVQNRFANIFAKRFYASLAEGKPVDAAVQDGRTELARMSGDESEYSDYSDRAFGLPVVFLQSSDSIIVGEAEAGEPERGPEEEKLVACVMCNGAYVSERRPICAKCGVAYVRCPQDGSLMCSGPNNFCPTCGYPKRAEMAGQAREAGDRSDYGFPAQSQTAPVGIHAAPGSDPVPQRGDLHVVGDGS